MLYHLTKQQKLGKGGGRSGGGLELGRILPQYRLAEYYTAFQIRHLVRFVTVDELVLFRITCIMRFSMDESEHYRLVGFGSS